MKDQDDMRRKGTSGPTDNISLVRRNVTFGLVTAATSALATPAIIGRAKADDLTKIKMILAWLPEGSYAYAFVARNKGFWRKRGLDVDIARGFGSFTSAQSVSAGQVDFAMTNPSSLVFLATKGINLKMIGLMDYDSFMAVGLLIDSPIKTPKDLEGKSVGQTFASSDAVFFKVFAERTGIDLSSVSLSNVDAKVRNQSLSSKTQDAITGLVSSILPTMETQKIPTRYFLYSDYGVDLYGNIGIACRPETVTRRPEICRAFMEGLTEGLYFTLTEPEEAAKIFETEVPETRLTANGPAFIRMGMAVQRAGVIKEPSIVTQGLGWSDVSRLEAATDLVLKYQAEPGVPRPKASDLFTNEFVGGRTLSQTELKIAQDKTNDINAMMRKS
jgi:NitT/TauT family transport system substrate-binding protein